MESEKDRIERLLAMELPTNDGSPNLLKIRHTASHVLAMAVQNLYPTAKVTIGPWIENGLVFCSCAEKHTKTNNLSLIAFCRFYYDFYVPGEQISDGNLQKIKKEMDRIIRSNLPVRRKEITRSEAE
jgi:threonyl-tRNA synthetase